MLRKINSNRKESLNAISFKLHVDQNNFNVLGKRAYADKHQPWLLYIWNWFLVLVRPVYSKMNCSFRGHEIKLPSEHHLIDGPYGIWHIFRLDYWWVTILIRIENIPKELTDSIKQAINQIDFDRLEKTLIELNHFEINNNKIPIEITNELS